MRLSLLKVAHAVMPSAAWQEIRVRSGRDNNSVANHEPRPTQGDEKRLQSGNRSSWKRRPPFVIPSAAEGSAVLRTIPGNVFRQSVADFLPRTA